MADFTVKGKNYRSAKMDVIKQFHVLRRMGPLYPNLMAALRLKNEDPMMAISFGVTAMSKLSDEDFNFILSACLSSCQINQGGQLWVALMANNTLMFQDLVLEELLEISWNILRDNFEAFILALLEKVSGAQAKVA